MTQDVTSSMRKEEVIRTFGICFHLVAISSSVSTGPWVFAYETQGNCSRKSLTMDLTQVLSVVRDFPWSAMMQASSHASSF